MAFWTAVHEMGHGFNLAHAWQKALGNPWIPLANQPEARTFMNYPFNVAGGETAFFSDFRFRFTDDELVFMRHAPRRFVQVGNANWFDNHCIKEMCNGWNCGTDQHKEYSEWMKTIRRKFHQQFRPIQAHRGKQVEFCSVMSLRIFADAWADELLAGSAANSQLKLIQDLAQDSRQASDKDIQALTRSFREINKWIQKFGRLNNRSGIGVTIGTILDPERWSCWVGNFPANKALSAQHWRNRLGLIHITGNDGHACGRLLVRLRFAAAMADHALPDDYIGHRNKHSNALWLFRPGVVHGGNRRFVQGVSADQPGQPACQGKTRDLSTAHYLEGEDELLLLAGEKATLMWANR